MSEQRLPRLHYVGDAYVGVVSDCRCPEVMRPFLDGQILTAEHAHEQHDIVPVRNEDELPEGVDFEHYKAWCRMFAAAPDLFAACELWDQGFRDGEEWDAHELLAWLNNNRRAARAAIAKAKGGRS